MKISNYSLKTCTSKHYTLALIADFHDSDPHNITNAVKEVQPDYILINGDLLYAAQHGKSIYNEYADSRQHIKKANNVQELLCALIKIAPVLFSTGNHELYLNIEDECLLRNIGIIILKDSYIRFDDLCFGGLSSPYWILAGVGDAKSSEEHKTRWKAIFDNVHTEWLDDFEKENGYKILLNHHPEFYEPYLKVRKGIDLILCGHTHGGQIRFFGKGLYAYGQGWFPKYSKGLYEDRMLISAGLANTSRFPRINNPTELVFIELN